MWERTLQDLIRGLRSHRHSSKAELDAFLDGALAEIREELTGKDMELKAGGLVKMCYLMMLYPIPPPPSFSFHVVEVMSSPRYHLKQLGYLAAPLAFTPSLPPTNSLPTSSNASSSNDDPILLLSVNNIRKDLLSPHPHLPPLALAGLGDIMTDGLAREVEGDLEGLLGHTKAYVRKRAVLALFKVFERYPEAMRTGFPRLRERLEDDDPGVVSATVNVITELSRRTNPKNYLPLAPQLFELLTTSNNNWMLIKIVKLFANLTPVEPRLVRKLLPPLTNLISTTPAISLLYECVRTCIVGGMLDGQTEAGDALARVCVEKLSAFLTDEDQNLKYIALLAMVKIVPSHPDLVADYQDEIMQSLDDEDVSIRMRALELVSSMVNRRNAKEIVGQLLSHLVPSSSTSVAQPLPSALSALTRSFSGTSSPSPVKQAAPAFTSAYRLEVARRILSMTRTDTYANITDFEWYLSVLVDLVHVANVNVGAEIRDTLLDVVGRVRSIREYAVSLMSKLLADTNYIGRANEEGNCSEVIYAAAWICGEYSQYVVHAAGVVEDLLQPPILSLDPATVAVCVFAATKVFGHWATVASEQWDEAKHEEAKGMVQKLMSGLERFERSQELEVQERAANFRQLFRFIEADLISHHPPKSEELQEQPTPSNGEDSASQSQNPPYPKSLFLLQPLFTGYEMNSVGYKAQESVRLPEGLDLDAPLVESSLIHAKEEEEEFPDASDREEVDMGDGGGANMDELRRVLRSSGEKGKKGRRVKEDGSVETKEERAARKAARKARHRGNPYYVQEKEDEADDVESIPIVKLELDLPDEPKSSLLSSASRNKSKFSTKEPELPPVEIDRSGEMPEGADVATSGLGRNGRAKGKEREGRTGNTLLDVDLTQPDSTDITGGAQRGKSSRFEEYKADEEIDERRVEDMDVPAAEGNGVKVVKVKKKKKKKAGVAVE